MYYQVLLHSRTDELTQTWEADITSSGLTSSSSSRGRRTGMFLGGGAIDAAPACGGRLAKRSGEAAPCGDHCPGEGAPATEGGRRRRITAPSGGDGRARRQRKAGTARGSRQRRGQAGELVGGGVSGKDPTPVDGEVRGEGPAPVGGKARGEVPASPSAGRRADGQPAAARGSEERPVTAPRAPSLRLPPSLARPRRLPPAVGGGLGWGRVGEFLLSSARRALIGTGGNRIIFCY